jgi:hypothetical protein
MDFGVYLFENKRLFILSSGRYQHKYQHPKINYQQGKKIGEPGWGPGSPSVGSDV